MTTGSVLEQVYLKQRQSLPDYHNEKLYSKIKSNANFILASSLVGGFFMDIGLADVVVFYVKHWVSMFDLLLTKSIK